MKGVFEKKDDFVFTAKHVKGFKGFPPMFHPHCELIYVTSGEIDMMIDGYEHTLISGEISTVFPYVVHSYESSPDAEAFIILFDTSTVGAFENDMTSSKPPYPYIEVGNDLTPLFYKVVEHMEKAPQNLKTASAYLSAIVGELLERMELCAVESMSENMIKPVLLYCSEHFSDDDISIKKIADELYISQSYVSKIFASKLKYRFREYINELRISYAKKLLSESELKIVDVMLECGFKNQSSFNRIFSQICSLSPSEYRRKKKIK